jgi:hypothetical protein
MPLELLLFAGLVVIATFITTVTLAKAETAETVAARSVRTNAEVIDNESSSVTVRYTWNGTVTTAVAPVESGGGYQHGLLYPIVVDPLDPISIRMAMEPYNASGPITWVWLIAGISVVPVLHRFVQRRAARRRLHTGPWQAMFAVTTRTTPRFAVVQLHASRDWPGSRRGIVLMPQLKPWRNLSHARDVIVCGTLNTLDSPVLIIDGRAHIPASRLYFDNPLLSRPPRNDRPGRQAHKDLPAVLR